MEASLQVPTATSIRNIPVKALEENRRVLNNHLALIGQPKASFRTSSRGRSSAPRKSTRA
jgi:2-oxoglutarate dehydrogenase E1 component